MAKLFLDSTDTNYKVSNSNTTIFGANGDQAVTIDGSLTGIVLDANVERVAFSGATSDYTYKQVGTDLEVYKGTALVTKIGLQDDDKGTQLTFINGTVDAKFAPSATGLGLTVGGQTVATAAPAAVTIPAANIDVVTYPISIPTLSVASVAATATEGTNALWTVTLANPATTATTVKYTLTNVGGASNADTNDETITGTGVTSTASVETAAGSGIWEGMLTFAAGATTATISLPVALDGLTETGEGVSLSLSNPSTNAIVNEAGKSATVTFVDAPATTFTLTSTGTGVEVQEGQTITFTVTPNAPVNAATTLVLNVKGQALGGVTATTSPADFETAANVTFAQGDTAAKTITLKVASDTVTEGREAYAVDLLDTTAYASRSNSVAGVITDALPNLTLTASATAVNEGAAVTYTVTSDIAAPAGGLTVPYTIAGTATSADYTTAGTLNIAAGAKTASLTINATADNVTEGAETVSVQLGTVNGANVVTTTPVSTTINDTSVALAANAFSLSGAATVDEGATATYTVTRGSAATVATTVPYTITGTAVSGSDYTGSTTGTVSFAVGATTATISLPVTADLLTDPNETIIVTLGTPSNTSDVITTGAGSVTTTVNDTSVSVTPVAFTLTTGIDNVTSSYNTVNGVIDQAAVTGNTTWSASDTVAPAAGSTANLNLLTKNATTTAGLNSSTITTLAVRATDQTDGADSYGLNVAGFTGLTKVSVANSAIINTTANVNDTLTVSGLPAGVTLDLNNNGASQNVTATGADWSGTADTLNVSVAGRTGTVTLGSGANNIETVALSTSGSAARLASLVSGTASNKTVTVTGTGLKIDGVMDNTITSFDASNSTGNVNVYLTPGTKLTSAKAGTGTADTLAVDTLPASLATISGFERLQVEASGTYDLSNAASVTTLVVDATVGGTIAPSFMNATSTQGTILVSGAEQRTTVANATNNLATGAIGYLLKTSTGTSDALTLTVNNGGVASSSTTAGTLTLGGLTANAIETVTVNAADFKTVTLGGLTAAPSGAAAFTLTVPATSSNLALGTLAITHGSSATTPDIINLSAVTGTTSATIGAGAGAAPGAGALTYTGGTGVDTVTQNETITASNTQTYNLGAGNDAMTVGYAQTSGTLVVNTEAGDDSITLNASVATGANFSINGGDGTDTLKISGGTSFIDSLVGVEKIFNLAAVTTTIAGSSTAANNSVEITQIDAAGVTAFTTTAGQAVSIAGVTAVGTITAGKLTLTGLTGNESLTGSSTIATSISGAAGNDTIIGGSGADTITGGTGADSMTGGAAVDIYVEGQTDSVAPSASSYAGATLANNDTLTFANGVDVITDFASTDTIDVTTAATTYTTLAGVTVANNLTANTHYYVQGTYVASTGVFTVNTAATAATANYATLIVADATAGTIQSQQDIVILTGVLASDLSTANFV